MKWDIDAALVGLEPERCPGTTIQRVYMDLTAMARDGVKPTKAQAASGGGNVWCVALGLSYERKAFFFGQTIRATVLAARRAARDGQFDARTPWGKQPFVPSTKSKRPPTKRKK